VGQFVQVRRHATPRPGRHGLNRYAVFLLYLVAILVFVALTLALNSAKAGF
jgi:hypothetical protein